MSNSDPLVEYEAGGQASIINYNVPLPTSYGCRSLIELDFATDIFRESVRQKPETTLRDDVVDRPFDDIRDRVVDAIDRGFHDKALFGAFEVADATPIQPPKPGTIESVQPTVRGRGFRSDEEARRTRRGEGSDPVRVSNALRELANSSGALDSLADEIRRPTDGGVTVDAVESISQTEGTVDEDYQTTANYYRPLAMLKPDVIASHAQQGRFMYLTSTVHGDLVPTFHPEPVKPQPQFAIVERYQLSNFLGNYGAGRTLKTFSLFPGEETTIRLKTFRNNTSTRKEASSILEGSSREAAVEFGREIESEVRTSTKESDKSFWSAGGKAELSIGPLSIGGGGGGGGESHAIREHIAKSVARATSKHANKSSSKREVEVKTESSQTSDSGTEELIERHIENINLSRTLNLVFRQMNQQFLSLFHLVDARVAFSNGYPGSYREAPLYELDALVDDVVTEDDQQAVKDRITAELDTVFDHSGTKREDFITEVQRDGATYLTVDEVESTYTDDSTDLSKTVSGIILSGTLNSLRTDGVIVEALLGRGEALDDYSRGLQNEAVRERGLENDLLQGEADRNALGIRIAENGTQDSADVFHTVFGEHVHEDESEESVPQTGPTPNDD